LYSIGRRTVRCFCSPSSRDFFPPPVVDIGRFSLRREISGGWPAWRDRSAIGRSGSNAPGHWVLPVARMDRAGDGSSLLSSFMFNFSGPAGAAGLACLGWRRSLRRQQAEPATKSVAGKVTSIGKDGHSFAIVSPGDTNQTLEFVIDQNTKVQGEVHVGTTVTVAYQAVEGGENLAVAVTAQG